MANEIFLLNVWLSELACLARSELSKLRWHELVSYAERHDKA